MISFLGVFNADLKFRVNKFPKPGETIHGLSFEVEAGGKGFNQAVAAQRAGANAKMLTWLGDDNFAEMAQETMAREGIDFTSVRKLAKRPTGTAMIMVEEKSAQNMIVIAPGAANEMDDQAIKEFEDDIAASSLLVTNFEIPFDAAISGLKTANKHNTLTVLDPAPAQKLSSKHLSLVDYLTPNESEAALLCDFPVTTLEDGKKAAIHLHKMGAANVIVTMGSLGCIACNSDGIVTQPAISCGEAVDTTGAGDAFNGAFCSQIIRNETFADTIKFASIAAGLAVTKPGAADAMPLKVEIEKILATE